MKLSGSFCTVLLTTILLATAGGVLAAEMAPVPPLKTFYTEVPIAHGGAPNCIIAVPSGDDYAQVGQKIAAAITVKGDGPGNLDFPATETVVASGAASVQIECSNPLPDYCTRYDYDDFTIDWTLPFDGGTTWHDLADSKNEVFVTLASPMCSPRARTVLYLACENGGTDTASCIANTWSMFSPKAVCAWGGDENDGQYDRELYYYDGYTNVTNAAGLLATGNGQCGAWADLLEQCFLANNVPNVAVTLVRPPTVYNAFGVKNITFDDANPTYPQYSPWQYKENSRTDDLDVTVSGEPGQNTNPPHEKLFGLHYIVHVGAGDDYYDPSYGITTTGPPTYTTTVVEAWCMRYEDPPHVDYQWRKRTGDPSELRFNDL